MESPQNPLKQKITRIFRSSFSSCKSRYVSDVIERPVGTRQHYQLIDLFSPKPVPRNSFPSICGPRYSEPVTGTEPRRKVSDRYSSLLCPPVSPVTPLNMYGEFEKESSDQLERKDKKKKDRAVRFNKKGRRREKKREKATLWPTEMSNNNYYDWSTSDDDVTDEEDDVTTFFSSKSLSSDSSDSFHPSRPHHSRRSKQTAHRKAEVVPSRTAKDGFAVVKRSSDPHSDFRTSMVEMIVEKQIFGARELEGLLKTFLSLNSVHHHRVILEVFSEIWEALFSDWS